MILDALPMPTPVPMSARHADSEADQPEAEEEEIIQKPGPDSPPRLADSFYYETEKIHSKPITTDETLFPNNTLSL